MGNSDCAQDFCKEVWRSKLVNIKEDSKLVQRSNLKHFWITANVEELARRILGQFAEHTRRYGGLTGCLLRKNGP